MHYNFSYSDPNSKYILIECTASVHDTVTLFQLPAWRPGRYELGNFARNVKQFSASDQNGNALSYKKITKDCWLVNTKDVKQVKINYSYYAAQLDAGGCWLDQFQLYINPVHCCIYIPQRIDEECEIEINIPHHYTVATSLKNTGINKFFAADYHELADSPFIASASLQYNTYTVGSKTFNIWMQGECKPDWKKILNDFEAFTRMQMNMMKEFPFDEYQFLVQVLPKTFYHGVEHQRSTVLALGPGDALMDASLYNEFIGVASHELFHAWNIKSIRPIEMFPYDYTRENYASTGYIYEGITTYYGDLFLSRSGFFSVDQYLKEISLRINKHLHNPGRYNYSVAQSSFDTWLDGYVPGVPGRKTSIYDEGSLIALMLDFLIRKSTTGNKSLDDVMHAMYFDIAKTGRGYSENDFKTICEKISGRSFEDFFNNYIHAAVSYESLLHEVLDFAGLELTETPSTKSYERFFGFTVDGANKVFNVAPSSPAEAAGLTRGDEIISINSYKASDDLQKWFHHFSNEEIKLEVFTAGRERILKMKQNGKYYFSDFGVAIKANSTIEQKQFFENWALKNNTTWLHH